MSEVRAQMDLSGLRIVESVYLTESGEPVTVRRTWRERLWSRPWRPWLVTKVVIPQVPMKGGYQLANGTILMHPAMVASLRASLRQPEGE